MLLTINADGPDTRPAIPSFLKKYKLGVKVLMEDPKQLAGYDYEIASSLYVIDRKGYTAGTPGDLFLGRWKKVNALLSDLIEGKPAPGPMLVNLEKAPAGYHVIWKAPIQGEVSRLVIAPPRGDQPAEIGALSGPSLRRWTAAGEPLPDRPLPGENYQLMEADLDRDGRREWIAAGARSFQVLDSDGEKYWDYTTRAGEGGREYPPPLEIAGFGDLDGDGLEEVVVRDGRRVVAKKALPGNLWETDELGDLLSVRPDPAGGFLIQTGDWIRRLDRKGKLAGPAARAPRYHRLTDRIDLGRGRHLDFFEGVFGGSPEAGSDIDADGRKEILVRSRAGAAFYDLGGDPILIFSVRDDQRLPEVAFGDLDCRPGDEVVIAVRQYGLVALGRGDGTPGDCSSLPRAATR